MTRLFLDANGNQVPEGSPDARTEWDDDDPAFLARFPDYKPAAQREGESVTAKAEAATAATSPEPPSEPEPTKASRKRS